MQTAFDIRRMDESEVALAVDWAAAEGWNPGLYDAGSFWAADRSGFFLGLLDGRPAGCISAVRYGADYGFVGFYIVKPELRGRGFGLRLWQRAMEELAGRTVGLDGVVAQQDNYRKSGFELAYRNIRYSGRGFGGPAAGDALPDQGLSLVGADRVARSQLLSYDSTMFFAARAEFLAGWLDQPEATALAVSGDNGRIAGYGVIRRCRDGWKIGPLFADDATGAEALLVSLADCARGQTVFLDVPEVNTAAVALAAKYRMTKVFETARMYRGAVPMLPLEKVFGITSFELG